MAWIFIRIAAQLIANTFLRKILTSAAWIIAALSILGILDNTISAMDGLGFKIGDFRLSVLSIFQSIISVVLFVSAAFFLSSFLDKRLQKTTDISVTARVLISKVIKFALIRIAGLIGITSAGIDLSVLAVFGGALGIGIGFGLQKVTSNFISGIIILFEKTVQNDDLIELNDGTLGFIRNTGSRASLIETYDGKEVMVPNEDLITNRVINYTHSNKKARITINIGVSYDCDIKKAQELILEAANEHPKTAKNPEPLCFLREFADSSVNFLLLFWINDVIDGRYGPQSDVLFSIWEKFKENNIEIPYPQRDIHIKESINK